MTVKVGITGGIGSGKSTVCRIFRILGVPVFEADMVARQLMNNNPSIKEKLIHHFGESIYTDDQVLDRKKLASIIFNDDYWLQKVNEAVHPEVRKEFNVWAENQQTEYVLHEAAILFESGFYKLMDQNILIIAEERTRIQRVIERDKISKDRVLERMRKQWSDDKKLKLADGVIYNNGELLIPQILTINENIKQNGKVW